ncbi:hypothetical protein L4X54_13800 [Phocaeicola vulgatus]|jgi:hypothetical protein|uniref:hypothetical protein n=1 Tax=Bacteroidaceae TaxID=815 RepID=UPI001C8C8F6F|nr:MULTISPECIES: hypothetical protein [Bacteroidaceae]MBX9142107.1 hypothetical protein [Bacteroides stercoris]MCG0151046.1 hypothetical protein [Phocaeicola vulgatus]MCG0272973.1 hypothetical protein [Phocaeicola vulgatus]
MEKKNGLLTAALLATVFLMGSCSSEDSEMGTPAQSGSPILFSVADVQPRTRTIYEDRLQINWVENDEIGICSPSDNVLPSVEGGPKNATYKVTALNADGHPHHAEIEASVQGTYLKWGNDLNTPAVFYGAYPAERIVTYPQENSGVFSMKYYTNQECKVYSSENGVYLTKPDMKNAYMMAKNELTPIGDHVLMAFDPIMTTPDITITAGSYEVGTGIIQPVTVTGVSIIMPKKLNSTDLNYKITGLTNGAFTNPRGELQDIADGQESVFIQIDNDGKKYVDLYEGESINLMAFLPPIPQLTGAKIRVHTLGSTDFVKTVEDELQAQSRITIKLPDITPETTKPNNWMSKLDDNTSLKSMSIPAYVCQENTENELRKIEDLFRKGVRAFDAEVFASTESTGFLERTKIINKSFIDKINSFFTEGKNPNEFVIVWIENTSHAGGIECPNGWIDFPDKITNAKGKIILLETYSNEFYRVNSKIGEKALFSFSEKTTDFKLTNSDWTALLNKEAVENQRIYNTIVSSKLQTGCTGIVTIPNAGIAFDDTYGDLLLQAIIDCNFKFKH